MKKLILTKNATPETSAMAFLSNAPFGFETTGFNSYETREEDQFASDLVNRYNNFEAVLEALKKIEAWELPETGKFWDNDKKEPMSYTACYGSNGAKDFFINLARTAIAAATITEDPQNPADAQGDEMYANQPKEYDP